MSNQRRPSKSGSSKAPKTKRETGPQAARGNAREIAVARGSGIALWRQIAEELENEIVTGRLLPGTRLPTEAELAERYSVNRHTLRRALAALTEKGLVEAAPRRGTFVAPSRIPYPIGRQTRFSENITKAGQDPGGRLLAEALTLAPKEMADWLGIEHDAEVIEMRHVREADSVPLCLATVWFPAKRFSDIGLHYQQTGSITRAFAEFGVTKYHRLKTRISSRAATNEEREVLNLERGMSVLVVDSVDADRDGKPISASHARFAASRVELLV